MAANLKAVMKVQSQWDIDNTAYEAGTMLILQETTGNVRFKMSDNIHKFNDLAFYGEDIQSLHLREFSPNTIYSALDVVTFAGDLYLAKVAFTSGGAFDSNDWYRGGTYYTQTETNDLLLNYVLKADLDTDVIVSLLPSTTPSVFKITATRKNLKTAATSSVDTTFPAVTTTNRGIATPEMYNAIQAHEARLNQLEGTSSRYIVDFSLFADPANPTQQELTDAYQLISGDPDAPLDGTTLIDQTNSAIQYQYILSATAWILTSNAVPVFSNGGAGTIVGGDPADANDKGKIVAGLDGKGSVSGLTTIISDQIAIDIENLTLKNEGTQTTVALTNGPYKITSSYASVECYGRLFIFDEQTIGKGIIRNTDGTISEVSDLGIYAPMSTLNTIHIIDKDDIDVCFIITEKTQSTILIIYPDGSYKTCDMGNINRTPQLIDTMKLLTSMNNQRHSLFMYNGHALGTATNTTITEFVLLQLEDCSFRILDNTCADCSGNGLTGLFNPAIDYMNNWYAFEDESMYDDIEPTSRDVVDTFNGGNLTETNGKNHRLSYKTGLWQTISGSPLRDRMLCEPHNGVFGMTKGAMILFPRTTQISNILITPEGFIGFFQIAERSTEYYHNPRFSEIKSGPYAGKRGLFFNTINSVSAFHIFIVNTPDGDPNKTICTALEAGNQNLNFLSGFDKLYNTTPPINYRICSIYTDFHRIYSTCFETEQQKMFLHYLNQKEFAPNNFIITDNKYNYVSRTFDYHILDTRVDTGNASSTWYHSMWSQMTRVDWGINPAKTKENVTSIVRDNRIKELGFSINTIASKEYGIKYNSIDTHICVYVRSNGAMYVYIGNLTDYDDTSITSASAISVYDGVDWSAVEQADVDIGNGVLGTYDALMHKVTFSVPLRVFDYTNYKTPIALDSSLFVNLVTYNAPAGKGTLVQGSAYNTSLFIPDEADTWNGEYGIRPYFIQHQDNEATTIERYANSWDYHRTKSNTTAIWNNQYFVGFKSGTGSVAFIRNFYYDGFTGRYASRKLPFAAMGGEFAPIVIDDKVMILMPNNVNTTRCIGIVKDDSQEVGYTVTDGGAFLPPRAMAGRHVYQRAPTSSELIADPTMTGSTYIFDSVTARSDYYKFVYLNNEDGTITPRWDGPYPLPASIAVKHMLKLPNGKLLLISNGNTNVAYSIPLQGNGNTVTLYNEINETIVVFDISNTQNTDESDFGCYLLSDNDNMGYFYTLEWDEASAETRTLKWFKRATPSLRIYALPSGEYNGVATQRFALTSAYGSVPTANNPFTIVERIGGKINLENPDSSLYTRIRDFGTDFVSGPNSPAITARPDLPFAARKLTEPRIIPWDPTTIRWQPKKVVTLNDALNQHQNPTLQGYKFDALGNPSPYYGEYIKYPVDNYFYLGDLENSDEQLIEVGLEPSRDSMIYFGYSYGVAVVLKDGFEAHPENFEVSAGNVFAGGSQATIWGSYNEANNYSFRGLREVIVENKIISSTINNHRPGQFTHEVLSIIEVDGIGPSSYCGYAGTELYFRKGKIAIRDNTRNINIANWSPNEALSIMDLNNPAFWSKVVPSATNYTGLNTFGITFKATPFETSNRTPLFQMMDNQILPGIYHRRNNQDLNPQATNGIVPYFQFTDKACDMVYKDILNTTELYPIVNYDDFRISPIREEHFNAQGSNVKFRTIERTDSNGTATIMAYYTDADGVSKYEEIYLLNANEFQTKESYANGYMIFTGVSKRFKLDVSDLTNLANAATLDTVLPDTLAVMGFDSGSAIVTFRSNDDSNLYEVKSMRLVLDYNGDSYYVIPLRDLNIGGNNYAENLSVVNQLTASRARIATLEADQIYVKSRFQATVLP